MTSIYIFLKDPITSAEVADEYGVTVRQQTELIKSGDLPAYRSITDLTSSNKNHVPPGLPEANRYIKIAEDELLEIDRQVVKDLSFERSDVEKLQIFLIESGSDNSNQLCINGDNWIITFRGEKTILKDSKGLKYLSYLLEKPGSEIAAIELSNLVNLPDVDTREIYRDYEAGLSKSGQLQGSNEKARSTITKQISDLKKKLLKNMPKLHAHLDRCLSTGRIFKYGPPQDFEGWKVKR